MPADRPRRPGLAKVGAAFGCGRLGEKRKVKLVTGRITHGTERADKEVGSKSLAGRDGYQLAWSHSTAKDLLPYSLPSARRTRVK